MGARFNRIGMILDDFFQDVPHHRILLLHQFLGLLDGGAMAALFQAMVDERLEQLQRHLLGKAALVQLQLGTDHDDGTAGVIDALAEQVLAEAALLALERIGQRLERAVVGAAQHTAAAAVIEQRIHGFLQHALFIAHDDVGRVQLDQLLQPVVAVDHAAVQVVQIGGGEAAAVQWDQRTQLGRNHRQHVQDHPLRLVAGLAEAFRHAQALGELQLLLLRRLGLHLLADVFAEEVDVDLLEEFLDALGAHHGDELAGVFLIERALALVGDDFALSQVGDFTRIDDHEGFEIQHAFQLTQRDIEQIADARRQALEEPHVRAGAGQLDVAQAFAADARQRDFDAALVADHAAVLHALVLAAQAFPVGDRSENTGAEQPVAFRLEGPVVDGFGLGDLAVRPAPDLFRRGERDANRIEVRNQIGTIVGG